MQVAITGSEGFIGRNVRKAFQRAGHRVILSIDNLSAPRVTDPAEGFKDIDVRELAPHHLGDIDLLLHLAALKSVPMSFTSPTADHNFSVDHHVLRTATAAGVGRILMASSCEVYGDSAGRSNREDDKRSPHSPYAVAKAAMEDLAQCFGSLVPASRIQVLRFFNTYGADEAPDAVIPSFVTSVLRRQEIRLEGDGAQRRDFSHVDDTCRRIVRIAEATSTPPVLNIGSGTSHSVNDILALLGSGHDLAISKVPGRRNEIMEFRASTSLLDNTIGRDRMIGLEEGLTRSLQETQALFAQAAFAGANAR